MSEQLSLKKHETNGEVKLLKKENGTEPKKYFWP